LPHAVQRAECAGRPRGEIRQFRCRVRGMARCDGSLQEVFMLGYIVRRLCYSVLIILGVLALTFVMFRMAAGDPAAAVLGKNPAPRDIENMRRELGTDLPVFFGRNCLTETFSSAVFDKQQDWLGIRLEGNCRFEPGKLALGPDGAAVFKRNFEQDSPVCAVIELPDGKTIRVPVDAAEPEFKITAATAPEIASVTFYREQASPFHSQLTAALGELVRFEPVFPYVRFFNFGQTLVTREPVRDILCRGIGPSLSLMIPVFIGEMIVGIALALLSAAFKGTWADRALVLVSVVGMSVSYLVFIIFGQWYFGYYFNWFPVWGWDGWRYLMLPVLIGVISGLGGGMRFYRTVFVNELNREYLRTALAKGCAPFSVYARHLLRNTALPIISRAATVLPFLFTGSLLLETFFGIPGLGYAGIDALNNSDLQLLKALVIMSALLFVGINLLTDIAYAWADPRVRLKK